jgi:hypothetical protein
MRQEMVDSPVSRRDMLSIIAQRIIVRDRSGRVSPGTPVMRTAYRFLADGEPIQLSGRVSLSWR